MTEALVVHKVLDAGPERVFRAWTDPAEMARWFFPGDDWTAEVTADVTVGGRFRIAMRAPDGGGMTVTGSYIEVDPPTRLRFTWSSDRVTDTHVTVELTPIGEGTGLTLTHEFVPASLRDVHESGWGGCIGHLADAVSATGA